MWALLALVKGRPWLKPVIAVVLTAPALLYWTHSVRRFAFSEALHGAAMKGDIKLAKELLSWGADAKYPLEFGTPLEEAKKTGNKEMIELLSR